MEIGNEIRELVENLNCLVACNYSRDAVVREIAEFVFLHYPNTTSFDRQEILENILELIYTNN